MLKDQLGDWLELQRRNASVWRAVFFGFLGLMVVANFFIHPHHPHFGLDAYPGFFAAFGLVVAVVMVLVLKKIVAKILAAPEDTYDRIG